MQLGSSEFSTFFHRKLRSGRISFSLPIIVQFAMRSIHDLLKSPQIFSTNGINPTILYMIYMIYKKVQFPLFFFAMAKKRKAAESMGPTTGADADPAGTTGIAGIAQYRVVGVPKIQVGASNIWLVLVSIG